MELILILVSTKTKLRHKNMKSKIVLFTIIIFTVSAHTTNCMKRALDNPENPPTKRIKHEEKSLALPYDKLYSLVQEQLDRQNHFDLLHAIERRDIIGVTEGLIKQPKRTFLEWSVAIQFWQGVHLILQYGKPTEPELIRSLEIAIRTENIPLIQDLVTNNARLDTKSKTDPQIKNVLHKNPSIVDILLNYGLTFIDAINMDLSIDTIDAIIQKTKPKQSEIDHALQYTNKKNYPHISCLLVAAK